MSATVELTVSSQLSTANTVSDIKNHTGPENRAKFKHANQDINIALSHLNTVHVMHDRMDLLHDHYDEMIQKRNKNNNSEARRWTLESYLESFEGKKVKAYGIQTNNEQWATASQISYLGGQDSLNPFLDEMRANGVPEERLREAYDAGYKEYIELHNQEFPTLPIYRSDIHFDETTWHGHDAIVIKGHTQKGRPSPSLRNALGEHYGYAKDRKGHTENFQKYRDDNDALIFSSITGKFKALADEYGLDVEFEAIRTGQEGSLDMPEYKSRKEFERKMAEQSAKNSEINLKMRKKNRETSSDLKKRSQSLDRRSEELDTREAHLDAQTANLRHTERALKEKEEALRRKQEKIDQIRLATEKIINHIVDYSPFKQDKEMQNSMNAHGLDSVDAESVVKALQYGAYNMTDKAEKRLAQKKIEKVIEDVPKTKKKVNKAPQKPVKQPIRPQIEDDGPEL